MKYMVLMLLISFVFLGISCQKKEVPAMDITGKEWRLAKWSDTALDPVDFTITAIFTKDNISGQSAVNQYNGPYTIKNNEFSVGTLVMTRMAGSPDQMKAEQTYHYLLGKARKYSIDVSGLSLQNENNVELLFFIQNK